MTRNASHTSGINVEQEEERTIWHGYLLCLKSKGGVRQWKRLWVVLRPKHVALYKNEEVSLCQLLSMNDYRVEPALTTLCYLGILHTPPDPYVEHHLGR